MAVPLLLPGLFLAGAAHQLGPPAAAIAASRSEVNTAVTEGARTPEAVFRAERLMDSIRSNAEAIRLLKKYK